MAVTCWSDIRFSNGTHFVLSQQSYRDGWRRTAGETDLQSTEVECWSSTSSLLSSS